MPRYHSPRGRFTHYFGRRWDLGLCGQRSKRVEDSEYTNCPKCLALMEAQGIPKTEWRPAGLFLPDGRGVD